MLPLPDAGIAAYALQMVNTALNTLKQTREAAKAINDSDIKEQISQIYDQFLDLKDVVIKLQEENGILRSQLQEKQTIKRGGDFGYFYKDGENDPGCPKCYQTTGKFIYLDALAKNNGYESRTCRVCQEQYYESSPALPREQRIKQRQLGQQSWMGN